MQQLTIALQSNIIGIILMAITLFSLVKNLRSGILADKLFYMLTFSVMVVCFLEIMGTIFNMQLFTGARELNKIFNALLFAANPIPAFLWALFANCKIYQNEKKLRKTYKLLAIPMVVVIGLSLANLFTDVFFSISTDNVYVRTNFFFVSTLLSVVYIIYVLSIVISQRKNIGKELYIPLLSFMILPVIGLTVQFLFYGIYVLWVSIAISVIIIFNHVQNDYSITDWLTGLYNRKHLDNYLQQMCKRKRTNLIVGLMIDIDLFKIINDTHGHLIGDKALKDTATILKHATGNKAYVSRYAGDEFVIILELDAKSDIKQNINKIHESITMFNNTANRPYKLQLSIGHAVFKGENKETEDEFLSRMDSEMYLIKNR